MNTELFKPNDATPPVRGWIYYDAECGACVWGQNRVGRLLASRGWQWVPLQTPGAAQQLGCTEAELLEEMRLKCADGSVHRGLDAWIVLSRSVRWLSPLGFVLAIPGVHGIAAAMYRWFARHRHRFSPPCPIDRESPR